MLREIMQAVKDGAIKPLPLRIFSADDSVSAFRYMQQAKHVGKIVIVPAKYSDRTAQAQSRLRTARFSGDASYLITGGLGGLGLRTALWMAERGAGCLVLMGRSAPSAEASAALDAMKKSGARVVVYQGDVANEKDVAAISSQIKESLPPLRGIIHSAAVLDDGSLLQQSWARFAKVMAPKVRGAWLLSPAYARSAARLFCRLFLDGFLDRIARPKQLCRSERLFRRLLPLSPRAWTTGYEHPVGAMVRRRRRGCARR